MLEITIANGNAPPPKRDSGSELLVLGTQGDMQSDTQLWRPLDHATLLDASWTSMLHVDAVVVELAVMIPIGISHLKGASNSALPWQCWPFTGQRNRGHVYGHVLAEQYDNLRCCHSLTKNKSEMFCTQMARIAAVL